MRNQIARTSFAAGFLLLLSMLANASAANLDQRVELALGQGEEAGFQERLHALHSLYTGLSPVEAEALYRGIIAPSEPKGLPLAQWAALYNDAFNTINAMGEPLENYPQRLLGLVAEKERPVLLRDYALQHLLSHLEHKLGAAPREKILAQIERLVTAAPETTLPATYLLGTWQLAGKPGYPNTEAIGKAALEIASDPKAFTPNRITAIQVCGQLGYAPALSTARDIAKDTSLRTGLRAAAIATIGDLGDQSHVMLLRKIKYAGASDSRILYAADSALNKLQ